MSILPPAFEQIASKREVYEDGTETICDIVVDNDMVEDIASWGGQFTMAKQS